MTPELKILLEKAKAKFDAMTEEEKWDMCLKQAAGWARAEASWPKPKFHYEGETKVYSSYEDYCNG